MLQKLLYDTVDYLVIGHITLDVTSDGPQIGGTAAYSAMTARALGLRAGIVTSWGEEVNNEPLNGVRISNFLDEHSTTFENQYIPTGRIQRIYHVADRLDYYQVPEAWRQATIVHLAPVAQEVEPNLIRNFQSSFIGVTPQGWMRTWNAEGQIMRSEWPEAAFVTERAGATVISIEDVNNDEARVEELAVSSRVLAVTEGVLGTRLYWNGDVRRFRPPQVSAVDTTGAGDIFAAAFFVRLYTTRDPWEAARFATQLSAISVTRKGLQGVPTREEIEETMLEVL